jgi:carboxylesterase type B
MGDPTRRSGVAKRQVSLSKEPFLLDLQFRGSIEGSTLKQNPSQIPYCHYFGGLPYALPPVGPFRWKNPRPLPPCYRYGTRANPGRFTGGAGFCPQPSKEDDVKLYEEDCLQCNIWIPIGQPPKDGWPVFFYIHGGFLQWGSPNWLNPAALLGESPVKCIVVAPAYRLNVFGFLASNDLAQESPSSSEGVGNYGFWDQRLALEWTHQNISAFGGNASNITVGGYSAGSHSTFYQLAYDLYQPSDRRIIKRAMMLSNGPGVQPKVLSEHQEQYKQLLHKLSIPSESSPTEKLARLRQVPVEKLVEATSAIPLHEFRAVSTGFVRPDLFRDINSGAFAARMKAAGIKLMMGECRDEHFAYAVWRPPANDASSMFNRLRADYPQAVCEKLMGVYCPGNALPKGVKDWNELFGRIYADVQIHCLERGLVDRLVRGGLQPGRDILRYRVNWRAKCVDAPIEWGVTHATDMPIWFWGNGEVLEDDEKQKVAKWLAPVESFLEGESFDWNTIGPRNMRRINESVDIDNWEDDQWEEGLKVWALLTAENTKAKL